jgi:hypothetical protein
MLRTLKEEVITKQNTLNEYKNKLDDLNNEIEKLLN